MTSALLKINRFPLKAFLMNSTALYPIGRLSPNQEIISRSGDFNIAKIGGSPDRDTLHKIDLCNNFLVCFPKYIYLLSANEKNYKKNSIYFSSVMRKSAASGAMERLYSHVMGY